MAKGPPIAKAPPPPFLGARRATLLRFRIMGCGGSKGPVYSGDDRAGPLNVGDRVYAGNWGHAIGTVVKLKRQAGAYNNLQKKKNDIAEIEIDGVPESELRKTTRDGSVDEELIGLMAGSTVVVCERHVMKHFPVKLPQGHPGLTKKLPYGYPSPANIDRIRRDLKPKGLEIPTSPGSYLTALDKAARYFDGKEGYKPVDTSPATEANACSKFVEVQENLWLLGDAYLNDGVAELRKKEAEAKAEAARQAEEEAERARQRKADAAATVRPTD